MKITPEVIRALAVLRDEAQHGYSMKIATRNAFNVLDNADVFAEIDNCTDESAVAFDVDLVYKIGSGPTRTHQSSIDAVDEEEALAKVKDRFVDILMKAGLAHRPTDVEIISGTTSPCA